MRTQVAVTEDVLICRLAENVWSKMLPTANKGWPSTLGVYLGQAALTLKTREVKHCHNDIHNLSRGECHEIWMPLAWRR